MKKFYRPGDIWVLLSIAAFFGAAELPGYLNQNWLFGIGILCLLLGGTRYVMTGAQDVSGTERPTGDTGEE